MIYGPVSPVDPSEGEADTGGDAEKLPWAELVLRRLEEYERRGVRHEEMRRLVAKEFGIAEADVQRAIDSWGLGS